ncbi:hypothetical protein X798_07532 [Onchocerca flexuosa]|uniref:Uncharacterized protein n=1 Tax=Onchocerca flexuosa TaxID=387005 RepID=A0A238BKC2_9BILA|nr:hypothetical protein X798_07532 [Onchocerca flexuosa]
MKDKELVKMSTPIGHQHQLQSLKKLLVRMLGKAGGQNFQNYMKIILRII